MKINISFQKPFYTVKSFKFDEETKMAYDIVETKIISRRWFFYFKRYSFIRGFILRFLGIYLNVRENKALWKLLNYRKYRTPDVDFEKDYSTD